MNTDLIITEPDGWKTTHKAAPPKLEKKHPAPRKGLKGPFITKKTGLVYYIDPKRSGRKGQFGTDLGFVLGEDVKREKTYTPEQILEMNNLKKLAAEADKIAKALKK